jgi:hypothetical protein
MTRFLALDAICVLGYVASREQSSREEQKGCNDKQGSQNWNQDI